MIFYAGAEFNKTPIWILQMKIYSYLTLDIKPTDQQYDVLLVWKENSE
jgi:hypothetical protein